MKNQPFLLPLAGLVSGIVLAEFYPEISSTRLWIFLIGFLISIGIGLYYKKLFSLSLFVAFVILGSWSIISQNQKEKLPDELKNKNLYFKLKIEEIYKSSTKFRKYKAKVISADSLNFNQLYVLIYLRKQNRNLYPDDEIWVYSKFVDLPKPLNPYQFDYGKYLRREGISYTIFCDTILQKDDTNHSIKFYFSKFKHDWQEKLRKNGYSKNSVDIIGAMLLGDRTEMDQNIEETYRKTGVVHILSISGLHVMMVYSLFYFSLIPLRNWKNGGYFQIAMSLILLWAYVIFVGLQPPILRSALMISMYQLTVLFKRKPNVYHTLAVSAFLLLMWNPQFIWDVGFQLSYAAVFFIVWLNPLFFKWLKRKNRLLKILTVFFATSISAQLGTFPITAYHFHQTSGLFLVGNALMIPASYIMMIGGFFSVLLCFFDIFQKIWILIYNGLIEFCNGFISKLSQFDFLVFDQISFNLLEVFFLLILIFLLRIVVQSKKTKYLIGFLVLVFGFQFERYYQILKMLNKEELIVFHQTKNSVVGIRSGNSLDVFMLNLNDSTKVRNYILEPFMVHEKIKHLKIYPMDVKIKRTYTKTKNLIYWKQEKLILVNQESISEIDSGIYLIQNNSNHSFQNAKEIIIDGSNYQNSTSDSSFWRTREKGAYRIIR